MDRSEKRKAISFLQYFCQGMLLVSSPFLFFSLNVGSSLFFSQGMRVFFCILSIILFFSGSQLLFHHAVAARTLIASGIVFNLAAALPALYRIPACALFYGLIFISLLFFVFSRRKKFVCADAIKHRSRFAGAAVMLAFLVVISMLGSPGQYGENVVFFFATLIVCGELFLYLKPLFKKNLPGLCAIFSAALLLLFFCVYTGTSRAPAFVIGCAGAGLGIYVFRRISTRSGNYLKLFLSYPAGVLALTFLLLPAVGTVLLRTPFAMRQPVSVQDAAFTAVSAACVTGLSVLDISLTFSFCGQLFLLLLIQLGGLGIMSMATLILHALGRLSLDQERTVSLMSPSEEQELLQSLRHVIVFSLTAELAGAICLTGGFYFAGVPADKAVWFGVFTAVSAFCNAGFFPESSGLENFCGSAWVLLPAALLIISGGLAPVLAAFPERLRQRQRQQLPAVDRIVLLSSGILLAGGTLLFLLFEWNGVFREMGISEKIMNAFFLSATARTAGFSSVNVAGCSSPCSMVLLLLMIIGGSPGGTAGGIKTTALAILFFAFRAAVSGNSSVEACGFKISSSSIVQAIAVVFAFFFILILEVLMLSLTQMIPAEDILFESVSALATVGLSTGVTANLDAVGKIIVIIAMFIGRIGPLTFFLWLAGAGRKNGPGLPEISIPLG